MADVELTKMSSRGQVVIPQDLRDEMNLQEGETFAVVRTGDTLLLKRVKAPSREEILADWKKTVTEGNKQVKKLGIKQKDVVRMIHKGRGIKE
ncbi:MAG: AbrB/MazE/SpoVT family DNA-binding domain-containing protein [Candidatus Diapherotrites archaeon]|uniref:AbrB/MazE/SpoVT family DNA-binding domain-containing protein n=1 Tax=Candidatus Iainarchaeum sp. TaxID=3101447 RepID=A0A8T4L5B4_9ARCH|nr:AbrB/MazE/SpoVT family DNA-binding domain-containing protein [Candidatus Diapherotrites archaeon]